MKRKYSKLLLLMLFVAPLGRLSAQEQRVVFPDRVLPIGAAFEEIERQTDFLISYNRTDLNVTKKVRLSHNNLPLNKALNEIVGRSGRTYLIRGNHILVVPLKGDVPEPVAEVLKEPETVEEPYFEEVPVPEPVDLAKPPVDLDSLERALRARVVEYPVEIPAEPALDPTLYYRQRDRMGFRPGTPEYTDNLPAYALRTNLLYGAAALAPNIGAEFGTGQRTSLLVSGSYNGWKQDGTPTDNSKLCHWIVQTEFRYWLCERFNGHFFGAHAFYGYYNISEKKIPMLLESGSDKYRYKGNGYGLGLSYGYQLMLARNWNLEFNAGFGFGQLKYDKYECVRCGDQMQKGLSRTFAAPTKLGISLIYIIK